jgi:hypothetical protein
VCRSSLKPFKGRGAVIVIDSDSDSDVIHDNTTVKINTKLNTKKHHFSTQNDESNIKDKQINKINTNANNRNVNYSDSDSDIEILHDRSIKKEEKKNSNCKSNLINKKALKSQDHDDILIDSDEDNQKVQVNICVCTHKFVYIQISVFIDMYAYGNIYMGIFMYRYVYK